MKKRPQTLAQKMRTKLRANVWVLLPIIIVLAAAVFALVTVRGSRANADIKVADCQGAQASEFTCWQSRYSAITANDSPEAAMADFKKVYETNPYVKTNCHQIGHVIGRAAAKKYSSLAQTYKHGDQFCWSGYYHGAVETVAKDIGKDKIVAQLNDVCADFMKSEPYSFNHYNCVHGMGHGLMAVDGGELFQALDECQSYKDNWEAQSCYSGVFMENVMNEINPGQHSSYLKQDDPLYPCTAVKDTFKEQCYLMQTSHALIVVNYDYDKVFQLCSTVAAPYNDTCWQSLGRDVSGQHSSDQATTLDLCMKGTTYEARDNCFTGAVKDFMSYYHSDKQGLQMCAAIPDTKLAASCATVGKEYYKSF